MTTQIFKKASLLFMTIICPAILYAQESELQNNVDKLLTGGKTLLGIVILVCLFIALGCAGVMITTSSISSSDRPESKTGEIVKKVMIGCLIGAGVTSSAWVIATFIQDIYK